VTQARESDSADEEVERLWRAFRRDLTPAILESAGVQEGNAIKRLTRTWERLCEVDLEVAAGIHRAVEQVSLITGRLGELNSPADHNLR
jgi:hypothetical protein